MRVRRMTLRKSDGLRVQLSCDRSRHVNDPEPWMTIVNLYSLRYEERLHGRGERARRRVSESVSRRSLSDKMADYAFGQSALRYEERRFLIGCRKALIPGISP